MLGVAVAGTQERRARYMELLHDYQRRHPNLAPSVTDLLGEPPDEHADLLWRETINGLGRDGLVQVVDAYGRGNTAALLTERGRSTLEDFWKRRRNPAERRKAAVHNLLHWLHEQDPDGTEWVQVDDVLTTSSNDFGGEPLGEAIIRRAAVQLVEEGLAKGAGDGAEFTGPSLLQITDRGQRCVESGDDVDEYLLKARQRQPTISNVFNAPISHSNIAAGSTHVTQTLSSSGLAGDDLKVLLRALTEALPVLGLADDQADVVRQNVEYVEGELQRPEPDEVMVKTMMRRTADAIGTAASSALASGLNLLVKYQMERLGIPIE